MIRGPHAASPLLDESLAMLRTPQVAKGEGLDRLQVFSYSLTLINLINSGATSSELYGDLHDIRALIALFSSISFSHIPRSANEQSDLRAKSALDACRRTIS
ncbi:unnamed protein product [Arabis nemorensis]|uniref:RNase H type-1 domain-containing protein n=1 Tax=Arabis nemorensis TaxID=586526 RepID=A0A565AT90_9BRAS|nr:unnamed protein product [Arabis nemorensis]